MERNANYALVGLASAILLMGLVVFLVLLAGRKFSHDYDVYDIVFQGPVRGLAKGGEVDFNGIKVGDVSRIFLDPHNPQYVVARARITPDVPIRVDSYAQLEPQGITGVNYIQISAGTPSKPLLRDTVREGEIPRISSQKDALSDLLAGGGFIVQRSVEALDRVNRVFSDENIKTLTATMNDIQAVTGELRERKAIIADAQKALQDSDEAVRQFNAVGKSSQTLLEGDGRKALAKIGDAAAELQSAAKTLNATMIKLQGPAENFAVTGLPQLTGAINSLQRATDHLDRVLGEVEGNPRGVLNKAPAKEVEVRP
jgi:phospholipid/cholesterol/gamma-HCH transport system substrate-binding protein